MKNKFVWFAACLIVLLLIQAKVVIPFLTDIAASDLFLEETGDDANPISSVNEMTTAAYKQCNTYIASEMFPDAQTTPGLEPINAFGLGSFQYVINAEMEISSPGKTTALRKYVCRISYDNGKDLSELGNPDAWSIDGISGLDDI